ncbi:DUF559 domain-containing protein [Rhodoblastus acidophilus]
MFRVCGNSAGRLSGTPGFTILRFWNHEILHAREAVENTILARCGLPW